MHLSRLLSCFSGHMPHKSLPTTLVAQGLPLNLSIRHLTYLPRDLTYLLGVSTVSLRDLSLVSNLNNHKESLTQGCPPPYHITLIGPGIFPLATDPHARPTPKNLLYTCPALVEIMMPWFSHPACFDLIDTSKLVCDSAKEWPHIYHYSKSITHNLVTYPSPNNLNACPLPLLKSLCSQSNVKVLHGSNNPISLTARLSLSPAHTMNTHQTSLQSCYLDQDKATQIVLYRTLHHACASSRPDQKNHVMGKLLCHLKVKGALFIDLPSLQMCFNLSTKEAVISHINQIASIHKLSLSIKCKNDFDVVITRL